MKENFFFRTTDTLYRVSEQNRFQTINLDLNENLFGCDPRVVVAIRQLNEKLIYSYPQKDEFENHYARLMGLEPEEVVATNGTDAGIEVIMKALLPGTKIVIPYPTFGMYEICAEWYGRPVKKVWYDLELNFPMKEIIKEAQEDKSIIFVANPDSPTGGVLDLSSLEELISSVVPNPVVIDETYYQYAGISAIPLLKKYPNLIILHSFSKVYGLAGLRIGALLTRKEIAITLRRWMKPFEVNQVALLAATEALRYPDFVKEVVKKVEREKKRTRVFLENLGLIVRESSANFLLIRTGIWTEEIVQKLAKVGILVKKIHYPPVLDGWIRMNVGPEDIMNRVMDEFRIVFGEILKLSKAKKGKQ